MIPEALTGAHLGASPQACGVSLPWESGEPQEARMPIWDGSGLGSGNPPTGDQSVTGQRQLISRAHQ